MRALPNFWSLQAIWDLLCCCEMLALTNDIFYPVHWEVVCVFMYEERFKLKFW